MSYPLFIISDGTGRTAKQTLKAALTQFENVKVQVHLRSHVRSEKQVLKVISEARDHKGIVLHTVVSNKLREFILEQGRIYDVSTIDLMGPLLAQLSHFFDFSPSEKPGIFHELNKSYFQRIEAVEFTLRHDDGQKIRELKNAEIVILGVSRTFKTPLSIYLSFKGWLVANIPIILDITPPDILFEIPPERVYGLTTRATRLADLRSVRTVHLGGATGDYSKIEYVRKELKYANEIYKKNPNWSVIDVTNKPIEEIASEILTSIRNN